MCQCVIHLQKTATRQCTNVNNHIFIYIYSIQPVCLLAWNSSIALQVLYQRLDHLKVMLNCWLYKCTSSMIHSHMTGSKSMWSLVLLFFCCFEFYLFTVWISVDIIHWRKLYWSRNRKSPFYLFGTYSSCASLGFQQSDSVWFLTRFQQSVEDHICSTKSNTTDISLVESCGVQIMSVWKKKWTESLPALYYLVYCEYLFLVFFQIMISLSEITTKAACK